MKLAGAMKPTRFLKNDKIITYGDVGSIYYILSKGSVKVILYNDGTKADDENLSKKIKLTKYMG